MACTALTPVVLTANSRGCRPGGTALDATNSHTFTATLSDRRVRIRHVNTTAAPRMSHFAGDSAACRRRRSGISSSLADGSSTTVKWFGLFNSHGSFRTTAP